MAEMRESNKGLSLKVDVDCSEALVGLKALRREAEKTRKELEELKKVQENGFNLDGFDITKSIARGSLEEDSQKKEENIKILQHENGEIHYDSSKVINCVEIIGKKPVGGFKIVKHVDYDRQRMLREEVIVEE
ncbi:MAG: hypothetical protein ACQET8_22615 [Bacillota bacterium]